MIRFLFFSIVMIGVSSCARTSYQIEGVAKVRSWEGDLYCVPDASVYLIHKGDTLRTSSDDFGRYDFGRVKYRNYVLDGHHPELGVARLQSVNRSRERKRVAQRGTLMMFRFARVESNGFIPDTLKSDGETLRHGYFDYEMEAYNRHRMPRWVVSGYVCDGRTMSHDYAWPKVLPESTVCIVNKQDTIRVKVDEWGRFAVWGMRGDVCQVWAECAGYEPSTPQQISADHMYAVGRICRKEVHSFAVVDLWPTE